MNENTERLARGPGPEQVLESSAGSQHPLSVALLISCPAGREPKGQGTAQQGSNGPAWRTPPLLPPFAAPGDAAETWRKLTGGVGFPLPLPSLSPSSRCPFQGPAWPPAEEGKEEGEAASCTDLDAVSPGDCVSGGKEDGEGQAAQRPGERREGDATAGAGGGTLKEETDGHRCPCDPGRGRGHGEEPGPAGTGDRDGGERRQSRRQRKGGRDRPPRHVPT